MRLLKECRTWLWKSVAFSGCGRLSCTAGSGIVSAMCECRSRGNVRDEGGVVLVLLVST